MSFHPRLSVGTFAAVLSLISAHALGTTLIDTRFDALRARADVVAHVKVETSSSAWTGEHNARIVTFHEVTVMQVLTGELAPQEQMHQRLLIGVPGGAVEDIGQWVPDSPVLEPGEHYLLLLGPASGPAGARGVVGLRYGVLPLAVAGKPSAPTREGRTEAAAP